jgi:GxxExxY protein
VNNLDDSLPQDNPAVVSVEIEAIARDVVDCGLKVHRALGPGLLESAYEACLAHEIAKRSYVVRRQIALPIIYDGLHLDAGYSIDLLISDSVLIEVKAVDNLLSIHQAQLMTYLKLSGHHLGFLMNFNVAMFKNGLRRIIR